MDSGLQMGTPRHGAVEGCCIQQQARKSGQAGWWLRAACGFTASQDLQPQLHHFALSLPKLASAPALTLRAAHSSVGLHRLLLSCSAALAGSLATAALGWGRCLQPHFTHHPLSASWFSPSSEAVTWELVRCESASAACFWGESRKAGAVTPTTPSVPQMSVIPRGPAYTCFLGLAAMVRTQEESGMYLLRSAASSDAQGRGFPGW